MIQSSIDLSVVIPCYNEAKNIKYLGKKLKDSFQNCDFCEIVLVDNGSTDDTLANLEKLVVELKKINLNIVKVPINKGYGYGIMAGLLQAKGVVLSWTHADLQTEPSDVLNAYEMFKKNNEKHVIVKGKRKNRPLLDTFFTFVMGVVSSIFLRKNLFDVNAQPKLFSRQFFNDYIKSQAPDDFSLDLFLLYCAKKYGKIRTIPVEFKSRLYEEAKGGGGSSFKTRWKLIKRTLHYIFTLSRAVN